MAMTARERQARRRAKLRQTETQRKEFVFEQDEVAMLHRLCVERRPGREPYSEVELLGLLIRQNHALLEQQLEQMKGEPCRKCGDIPPITSCVCSGDSECWARHGWQKLAIKI